MTFFALLGAMMILLGCGASMALVLYAINGLVAAVERRSGYGYGMYYIMILLGGIFLFCAFMATARLIVGI